MVGFFAPRCFSISSIVPLAATPVGEPNLDQNIATKMSLFITRRLSGLHELKALLYHRTRLSKEVDRYGVLLNFEAGCGRCECGRMIRQQNPQNMQVGEHDALLIIQQPAGAGVVENALVLGADAAHCSGPFAHT